MISKIIFSLTFLTAFSIGVDYGQAQSGRGQVTVNPCEGKTGSAFEKCVAMYDTNSPQNMCADALRKVNEGVADRDSQCGQAGLNSNSCYQKYMQCANQTDNVGAANNFALMPTMFNSIGGGPCPAQVYQQDQLQKNLKSSQEDLKKAQEDYFKIQKDQIDNVSKDQQNIQNLQKEMQQAENSQQRIIIDLMKSMTQLNAEGQKTLNADKNNIKKIEDKIRSLSTTDMKKVTADYQKTVMSVRDACNEEAKGKLKKFLTDKDTQREYGAVYSSIGEMVSQAAAGRAGTNSQIQTIYFNNCMRDMGRVHQMQDALTAYNTNLSELNDKINELKTALTDAENTLQADIKNIANNQTLMNSDASQQATALGKNFDQAQKALQQAQQNQQRAANLQAAQVAMAGQELNSKQQIYDYYRKQLQMQSFGGNFGFNNPFGMDMSNGAFGNNPPLGAQSISMSTSQADQMSKAISAWGKWQGSVSGAYTLCCSSNPKQKIGSLDCSKAGPGMFDSIRNGTAGAAP